MKKNKFFAGVVVLLFVLSFSVSQVLLAGEQPPSYEILIGEPCLMDCPSCACVWIWIWDGSIDIDIAFGGRF